MDILKEIYYDPKSGFISRDRLYEKVKDKGITRKQVSEFLDKQKVNQLYGDKKNYYNSFVVPDKNIQWQMDIGFFKNYRILFIVDVFSKWAYFETVKNETGEEVVRVLENAFKGKKPMTIFADNGKNFESKVVREYLAKNDVAIIYSQGRHASFVERLIRTIKGILQKSYKVGVSINTLLKNINENYNNTIHRTIKMTPNEGEKEANRNKVFDAIESVAKKIPVKQELKEGDKVRIKIEKDTFDKGYTMKYSKEVYAIESKVGARYKIEGKLYYNNQLKRVNDIDDSNELGESKEVKKRKRLRDELKIRGKLKIIDGKRK
jgi:hypothetical protein